MNHLGEFLGNSSAIHGSSEQSIEIGRLSRGDDLGNVGGKAGELSVRTNEVGLAGELKQSASLGILGNESGDGALIGLTSGLLSSLSKTVLAQNVNGGVHIAISLDEGLLALHHRRIGHLAELLDHSGGNLCHDWVLS